MYYWRQLSKDEQAKMLLERKGRRLPWHSPPHIDFLGSVTCIVTAACYEHTPIIAKTPDRLFELQQTLLDVCVTVNALLFAWCILPNHYHLLVQCSEIKQFRKQLGMVHGRTARQWNLEDDSVGRKVWFNFFDRHMRSARHFWASMNYIHNNAVHHGYVDQWQDWPYASGPQFVESIGRDNAIKIWNEYPVLDYGKDWDVY